MDRRDFLKTTIVTGITLAIPGNASLFIKALEAAEKTDLVVAHGLKPAGITKAAIDGLGGIRAFISRGTEYRMGQTARICGNYESGSSFYRGCFVLRGGGKAGQGF